MSYKTYASACKAPSNTLKERAEWLAAHGCTRADDREYMRIQRILVERKEHARHIQLIKEQQQ